ncbi:MAG: extracellular solute-binding protein [Spirochaetota bacterium]
MLDYCKRLPEFQKQNPAIKVTVNTVAHEQFKTQLVNYLTAKDDPDVLTWFAGFRMQQ